MVSYAGGGDGLAVSDLDGDGRLDIVAAAWGYVTTSFTGHGQASVFLNRGNGTFAPAAVYDTDMEATSVAVADFSADGRPDIAVVNVLYDLDIFVNQGNGAFGTFVHYRVPPSSLGMATSDFNRDGHPDLAITTQAPSVDIHLGDGAGGFAAPASYATGSNDLSLAVGDLNGDDVPDIVVSNADWAGLCPGAPGICLPSGLGAGTVNVLLNRGDGTFAAQVGYAAGDGTASVSLGDFDGDGTSDVVATNSVDDTLSVFLNNGDGTLAPPATYANAGSGTSTPGVAYPQSGGGVAAGDFNGDGAVDIVVARMSSQYRTGDVLVFANRGDGAFADPVVYSLPSPPYAVASADWNGDGLADLAVTTADGNLNVLLSQCE
jgi:hypothetical protein